MTNEEEQNTSLQPTEPLNTPPNNTPENTESTNNGQSNGGEKSGREWLLDYWNQKDKQKQQKQPNIISTPQPEQPKVNSGLNDDTRNWLMDYWNQKDEARLEQDRKRAEEEQEKVNRRTRQSKLHEGLERQAPGEDTDFDSWSDVEYEYIKKQIPYYLGNLKDEDEEVKSQIQNILNDSSVLFNSNKQLPKEMRSGMVTDFIKDGSFKEMSKPVVVNMMNELSGLNRLYWIALRSDRKKSRDSAIERINQLQKKYTKVLDNLPEDKKDALKAQILFTEYHQALHDLEGLDPDMVIYITPRVGSSPLITSVPTNNRGEFKYTVDDFRSDMLKLAMGRGINSVGLESGFSMTKLDHNGDLSEFDFSGFFNPSRYLDLTQKEKDELGKAGLNVYYENKQDKIVERLDGINKRIELLIKTLASGRSYTEVEKKKLEEDLKSLENEKSKIERDLKKTQTYLNQTQNTLQDEKDKVAQLTSEKEANEKEERIRYGLKNITASDPKEALNDSRTQAMIASTLARQFGNVGKTITDISDKTLAKEIEKELQVLVENSDLAGSLHQKLDANSYSEKLGKILKKTQILKNKGPFLKAAGKVFKAIPWVGDALTVLDLGIEGFNKWKNAEDFYKSLSDNESYNDFIGLMDDESKEYYESWLKENNKEPKWTSFYGFQLDYFLPKYTGNVDTIRSDMRRSEMDLVHSASQGYTNRTNDKKFKVDKNAIYDMLGLPYLEREEGGKKVKVKMSDKNVKSLEKNPWLLPFLKDINPELTDEEIGNEIKRLKNKYGKKFSDYFYE